MAQTLIFFYFETPSFDKHRSFNTADVQVKPWGAPGEAEGLPHETSQMFV
ncbi:hypothetical protein NTG1052_50060 [Candidatus Nitrotoga sp. 1052]|nr:hypothetical protein NTG1052_50060 [Candidatus Nitrotoga sp. 1052]